MSILQKKKALRIISFQPRDYHLSPLFKKHNLLKFEDKIQLENVLLVSKYFNNILPSIFSNWFTLYSDIHNYKTAASSTGELSKPSFWTNLYGKNNKMQLMLGINTKTGFGYVILKKKKIFILIIFFVLFFFCRWILHGLLRKLNFHCLHFCVKGNSPHFGLAIQELPFDLSWFQKLI